MCESIRYFNLQQAHNFFLNEKWKKKNFVHVLKDNGLNGVR